jgi:hypothetical protein
MTDLLAAVITLEAQAAGELDAFQGRAMHASRFGRSPIECPCVWAPSQRRSLFFCEPFVPPT